MMYVILLYCMCWAHMVCNGGICCNWHISIIIYQNCDNHIGTMIITKCLIVHAWVMDRYEEEVPLDTGKDSQ